jgi:hypothetical protein
MREQTRMGRIALAVAVVVALAGASGAPAGGIADEPCPNARGEQTNTCPAGTVGVPYSLRFVESEGSGCGSGRQTFHLDSGLLPHGLILTPDGTLKGIALETGSFKFYVEMREPQDDPSTCAGKRTQKEFTLRIRAQPWITSTPASPLGPEVGIPFRLTLRARGGTGIFHWDVGAGRLPVGLQLRDDGSIAGTPRVAGTYRFLARARDTESASITYPVTLGVTPRLIVPAPQTPAGKVGRFYSAKLATVGGIGRITWKLVGGRLPSGIRFAAESGTLIGTPRESGTHVVKVEARDRLNAMSTRTLAVVIRAAPRRDPARRPVAAAAAALRPSSSR